MKRKRVFVSLRVCQNNRSMRLSDSLKTASRGLQHAKVRSLLTMLGIIIGIGSVIGMVSLGQGAQASVQAQINSMGTNLLYITPGTVNSAGTRVGSGSATTFPNGCKRGI